MRLIIFLLTSLLILACLLPSAMLGQPPIEITPTANAWFTTPAVTMLPTVIPEVATPTEPNPTVMSYILRGTIYHDKNGNGQRDVGDPGLEKFEVCLEQTAGYVCAISQPDGSYRLDNLVSDTYIVWLHAPEAPPEEVFRYYIVAKGEIEIPSYRLNGYELPDQRLWQTEIHTFDTPLEVAAERDGQLDVAVTQGFLTDIFSCEDRAKITKFHGYDLNPDKGAVRNYLGDTSWLNHSTEGPGGTEDNHHAVDCGGRYRSLIGTPVRAVAPGVVSFAGVYKGAQGDCLVVNIAHTYTGTISGYVHLDKILVLDRQQVERGQLIGTLGMSCTTWPHVHFYLRVSEDQQVGKWEGTDPFRDTQSDGSLNWWTLDNQPVCCEY